MLFLYGRPIRRQVLSEIGDDIPSNLHGGGGPGIAGGELRIDTGGMVHEIGVESGGPDLIFSEVAGELVDQGAYHL